MNKKLLLLSAISIMIFEGSDGTNQTRHTAETRPAASKAVAVNSEIRDIAIDENRRQVVRLIEAEDYEGAKSLLEQGTRGKDGKFYSAAGKKIADILGASQNITIQQHPGKWCVLLDEQRTAQQICDYVKQINNWKDIRIGEEEKSRSHTFQVLAVLLSRLTNTTDTQDRNSYIAAVKHLTLIANQTLWLTQPMNTERHSINGRAFCPTGIQRTKSPLNQTGIQRTKSPLSSEIDIRAE